MTDLTKLTAKDLHDMLSTGLTSWTPPLYAVMREFVRRAEGYALACADRDSARDELAEMKALRDAAKSDHKEACRILRNYQSLAEERGREIGALIREREELHRRAQANDALLSTLSDWCFRRGADLCPTAGSADSFGEGMRAAKERVRRMLDAAAPAAPPTPAAPVTDAEIEAAITALTVDARREADALRVNPEASGTATEKRANRQVQLRALIARRVASAGAAPVDSEREAAIEASPYDALGHAMEILAGTPYTGEMASKVAKVLRRWSDKWAAAVDLILPAPPPPAGDQDAKLRELRARLVDFCRIRDRGYDVRSDFSPLWVLDEIDRLLAAPAVRIAEMSKPAAKESEPARCAERVWASGDMEACGKPLPCSDHTKPEEEPDWTVTLAAQANVASVRADKARLLTLIVEGLCNLGREVRRGGKS